MTCREATAQSDMHRIASDPLPIIATGAIAVRKIGFKDT